jgi:hypothetical protein
VLDPYLGLDLESGIVAIAKVEPLASHYHHTTARMFLTYIGEDGQKSFMSNREST